MVSADKGIIKKIKNGTTSDTTVKSRPIQVGVNLCNYSVISITMAGASFGRSSNLRAVS